MYTGPQQVLSITATWVQPFCGRVGQLVPVHGESFQVVMMWKAQISLTSLLIQCQREPFVLDRVNESKQISKVKELNSQLRTLSTLNTFLINSTEILISTVAPMRSSQNHSAVTACWVSYLFFVMTSSYWSLDHLRSLLTVTITQPVILWHFWSS